MTDTITAAIAEAVRVVVREEVRAAVLELVQPSKAVGEWLSVPAAAALLDVSPKTIRVWIKSRALPASTLAADGKRREYRIRRSDIEAMLSRRAPDRSTDEQAARVLSLVSRRAER